MPTKKQRRRREKERRHDYEYVYIDEEGNEVPVEQPPPSPRQKVARATASRDGRSAAGRGAPRGRKPVQPPSWRYMRRQAIIFFAIMLVVLALTKVPIAFAVVLALGYTLLMMPLLWLTQRMAYRSYLKRTGQPLPPPKRRSK
jgi:Flp pilus assembly protein TadB